MGNFNSSAIAKTIPPLAVPSSLVILMPLSLTALHFNDYSENLADAIDAKKAGIFVFFHMEECPFCQKMRRNVVLGRQSLHQHQYNEWVILIHRQ
jgi:thioredoxin-related protein